MTHLNKKYCKSWALSLFASVYYTKYIIKILKSMQTLNNSNIKGALWCFHASKVE